jgi:hypothetical protein
MDRTLSPFVVTTMPFSTLMKQQEDCKAYMDGFPARSLLRIDIVMYQSIHRERCKTNAKIIH